MNLDFDGEWKQLKRIRIEDGRNENKYIYHEFAAVYGQKFIQKSVQLEARFSMYLELFMIDKRIKNSNKKYLWIFLKI